MPCLVIFNALRVFNKVNMICPKLVPANQGQQNKWDASYSAAWLLEAVEDLSVTISDQVRVYKF